MKIIVNTWENGDCLTCERMTIDGQQKITVYPLLRMPGGCHHRA